MSIAQSHALRLAVGVVFVVSLAHSLSANTLCVNQAGNHGCYSKIETAVAHASAYDVIQVGPGTYKEDIKISVPLSLLGAGAEATIIDAKGLHNGIFVDGLDHPGLRDVTIAGFTVENALWEAIVVVSASDVIVRDNKLLNNTALPPVFTGAPGGCPGQPAFETDESGDCGGALHLVGTVRALVSRNLISGNADGILISDETGEAYNNLIVDNAVTNNPLDCGLTVASHSRIGDTGVPFYQPHFGIHHNTLAGNTVSGNGVQVQGAGLGMFSDGNGPGRVSENLVIHNKLTGNGTGGIAVHSHVGPFFGAPADNMDDNQFIGNFIAGNLADGDDNATPGSVGINISSGFGGSPITGSVISQNVIIDEEIDIAIDTPAVVDVHLNDLLGGGIGVGNTCAYVNTANPSSPPAKCLGTVDATQNYWGCEAGPGRERNCSRTYGGVQLTAPWLQRPVADDHDRY